MANNFFNLSNLYVFTVKIVFYLLLLMFPFSRHSFNVKIARFNTKYKICSKPIYVLRNGTEVTQKCYYKRYPLW